MIITSSDENHLSFRIKCNYFLNNAQSILFWHWQRYKIIKYRSRFKQHRNLFKRRKYSDRTRSRWNQTSITNLIKNSLNTAEPNKGKIEISIENDQKEIGIHVKDNRTWIPRDKQKDMFKKFYVNAILTREGGGSGLRLAICKGMVENHYGRIWAKFY